MSVRAEVRAAREVVREDPRPLTTWYWPVWIAVVAIGFIVGETWALIHPGEGGTKSERTRALLGIDPPRPRRRWAWSALAVGLALLAVWYPVHLQRWWPWEGG